MDAQVQLLAVEDHSQQSIRQKNSIRYTEGLKAMLDTLPFIGMSFHRSSNGSKGVPRHWALGQDLKTEHKIFLMSSFDVVLELLILEVVLFYFPPAQKGGLGLFVIFG